MWDRTGFGYVGFDTRLLWMRCQTSAAFEDHVIKNIFRYTKVRYRGILKNSLHLKTLCMLASLYLKRRVLAAAQG